MRIVLASVSLVVAAGCGTPPATDTGRRPTELVPAHDKNPPAVAKVEPYKPLGSGVVDGLKMDLLEVLLDGGAVRFVVSVSTSDDARRYEFSLPDRPEVGKTLPGLTDDKGNSYTLRRESLTGGLMVPRLERVRGSLPAGVKAEAWQGPVTSTVGRVEAISFDRPVKAATRLTLVVPAAESGLKGEWRFEVPASAAAELPGR